MDLVFGLIMAILRYMPISDGKSNQRADLVSLVCQYIYISELQIDREYYSVEYDELNHKAQRAGYLSLLTL